VTVEQVVAQPVPESIGPIENDPHKRSGVRHCAQTTTINGVKHCNICGARC